MPSCTDDDQLATAAAEGDAGALERLLERHYEAIHQMAWRWSGSAQAAEDIAQDVCVKIAAAIAGFRGDARFSTWLWRITYNASVDHLRAASRTEARAPAQMLSLVDNGSQVADTPESRALDNDLWQSVRALPPAQRDAVLLVYAQDMSHAEAAAVMGCKEATVSWHLSTARKALKDILEAAE